VNSQNTAVTCQDSPHRRHTLSGAQVREVAESDARAFLSRHSAPLTHQPIRLALGAFEDNGSLVGVLAITGPPDCVATIHLAIVPERRRLKLGTDLLHTVAAYHCDMVGPRPRFCAAVGPEAAERLRASIDPSPT
jgi:hypothetical protein